MRVPTRSTAITAALMLSPLGQGPPPPPSCAVLTFSVAAGAGHFGSLAFFASAVAPPVLLYLAGAHRPHRRAARGDFDGEEHGRAVALIDQIGAELDMWKIVSQDDTVEAAALTYANGDLERLKRAVALALRDWRDLLVLVRGG